MRKMLYCLIVIILTGCYFTPSRLTGDNIRLWEDTPAWSLAKAVRYGDTVRIKKILAKVKFLWITVNPPMDKACFTGPCGAIKLI